MNALGPIDTGALPKPAAPPSASSSRAAIGSPERLLIPSRVPWRLPALSPALALALALTLSLLPRPAAADLVDWWLTPDQQGQRLYDAGDYAAAAELFESPGRIGAALFAAGEFEDAAAVFGRQGGAEGPYNRGNALVFLGRYDEAIASYDKALALRPAWREAAENRAIAVARRDALAPPEDDAGGTGGKLGADEIVMDDSGRVANSEQEQVIEAGDQALGEDALRALWLRRVETRPADFLAAKFAAQLAQTATQETDDGESEP